MKSFISKLTVVVLVVLLGSAVATAETKLSCYAAFGSGVTEQIVDYPGMVPNPNPNAGYINLRIGRVRLQGTVDHRVTEGFDVPAFNPATGESRITGYGKGTFDFGELGAFHTWEVDTVTLVGPPPWEMSTLVGDIRTGPHRDFVPTPGAPPVPWGSGLFAHADATFKGYGWNRFAVLNDEGMLVNEFTYIMWGRICGVDLKEIRRALRD